MSFYSSIYIICCLLYLDCLSSFFDNPYDKRAIVIKNADGVKIGYIPRADNKIFARLMDAGKLLFGKISSKEKQGIWLKIDIAVFLHD